MKYTEIYNKIIRDTQNIGKYLDRYSKDTLKFLLQMAEEEHINLDCEIMYTTYPPEIDILYKDIPYCVKEARLIHRDTSLPHIFLITFPDTDSKPVMFVYIPPINRNIQQFRHRVRRASGGYLN